MLEVVRGTTLHSNNIKFNMVTIGQALNSDDRTRSSRQQMCRHLGVGLSFIARVLDLRTFLQVPCKSRVGANREMRAVVSPKIIRAVGVDNSATWFVDGMIHRQRRK